MTEMYFLTRQLFAGVMNNGFSVIVRPAGSSFRVTKDCRISGLNAKLVYKLDLISRT